MKEKYLVRIIESELKNFKNLQGFPPADRIIIETGKREDFKEETEHEKSSDVWNDWRVVINVWNDCDSV